MAVNYQNRVLLLLQPLLQLPQLSSFPSDRRASGQPEMSQICVCCMGISGAPQFFPFISVMQLQDLKWVPTSYEHPFTVSFPVSELRPAPMNRAWLDDVMKEGSLQSPSKGTISILQVLRQRSWADTRLRRSSRWGHSHWCQRACTLEEDLWAPSVNPSMCSSHSGFGKSA